MAAQPLAQRPAGQLANPHHSRPTQPRAAARMGSNACATPRRVASVVEVGTVRPPNTAQASRTRAHRVRTAPAADWRLEEPAPLPHGLPPRGLPNKARPLARRPGGRRVWWEPHPFRPTHRRTAARMSRDPFEQRPGGRDRSDASVPVSPSPTLRGLPNGARPLAQRPGGWPVEEPHPFPPRPTAPVSASDTAGSFGRIAFVDGPRVEGALPVKQRPPEWARPPEQRPGGYLARGGNRTRFRPAQPQLFPLGHGWRSSERIAFVEGPCVEAPRRLSNRRPNGHDRLRNAPMDRGRGGHRHQSRPGQSDAHDALNRRASLDCQHRGCPTGWRAGLRHTGGTSGQPYCVGRWSPA